MEAFIPWIIGAAVVVFLIIFFSFVPLGLWISASASGVKIGLFQLVGMRIRKVNAADIVNPMIKATKAGLKLPMNKLEAHYLAKGGKINGKASVNRVVDSLIAAQRAGIPLDFERSCAIDLAGRDVLNAVQMSVNPKVIETPIIAAVAMDGRSRSAPTSTVSSAAPGKRRSSRVSARASSPPSVPLRAIKKYWKTRIRFPARCFPRVWMPVPRLRFFPSTLQTSMSAETSAHSCRLIRRKRISASRRQKRRNAAPWQLRRNRRTSRKCSACVRA